MLPTPTLQVHQPLSRWQRIARKVALLLILILLCAFSFWAGQYSAASAKAAQTASLPENQPAEKASADCAAAGEAPSPIAGTATGTSSDGEEEPKDGLIIRTFSLTPDATPPGRLRYVLTVANSGRKFSGTLKFTISGERNGKPTVWTYPEAGHETEQKLNLEVTRFLRTDGFIPLPDGFHPEVATVGLQEPTGIRSSKKTSMGHTS